ncbi:hypothetical protein SLS56_011829 [Neofusicoccum ribis]|uniref:Major facilitator superfamily (MFS) profile domain-containing protein n=1 Tax=Neofusicoccum ribis TaxID=45134 RepID=A0ABR3SAK0_9PEZI
MVLLNMLLTKRRLHHIPGPFLASISNLWKLKAVWREDMPRRMIQEHEKHGSLLRIGPNHVSAIAHEDVQTVYSFTNILPKSDFYSLAEATYDGRALPTLFTTRSNAYHAQLKRACNSAYTMTAQKELEPHVDRCISLLTERIDEVTQNGRLPIDMSAWLHWFTFDVLGEVHFSESFGFMRTGSDIDNTIGLIDAILVYVSLIGQVPYVHRLLFGNPLIPRFFPIVEKANQVQNKICWKNGLVEVESQFALRMIEDRRTNPKRQRDLLARLLVTHDAEPSKLSSREVLALTTTNILAGSDTTATVLRTALYHMCRNKSVAEKLHAELVAAEAAGPVSRPITYNEAAKLPYLSAVLNEALRIHPPTGFILERVVPDGGIVLPSCDAFLPAGTVVGANPWVLHRDKAVFGEDVENFRPERWLECDEARIAEMHRRLTAFGIGPRSCIGKNISLLEMWKVLAELVRAYEFSLAQPHKNWRWFLVVVATLSSIFIYALDNTIVADIVPAIVNEFDGVSKLPWLSVGFSIGGVALVMPFGKLYGLFDAKWLYIISSIIFMAASALCGGAPNMNAEVVGRVFAGAGGNGMYLGVLTLLSVNTSDNERPMYLSLMVNSGLVWGVGTVLGPVVGGGFEKVSWRWAFYINLIIGGVFAPVYFFLLPPFDPAKGTSGTQRVKKLDWIGMLLSVGGFVTLIMAISFGGLEYAWSSGSEIALFVVGGVMWIAFAVQQVFAIGTTEQDRVFPVSLLRNREAVLLFLTMATGSGAAFIGIYYIPIYFQFARGDSGMQAAVRLLPYIFVLSFTILASGALMSKLGYYKPWYVVGSALALAGGVPLSFIDAHTSPGAIYGYEVLVALGAGAFAQAGYAVIQAVVDAAEMASALTFMMIAQLGGICFGLAVAGAVFLNDAQQRLHHLLPNTPLAQIQQVITGTSAGLLQEMQPDERAAVLDAIVLSLRKV